MSTYPGEDPQTPERQPAQDSNGDTSGTEPTQPVGYWERQAAEEAARRAGAGPQGGGGAVFNPTSAQPAGGPPPGEPTPYGQQGYGQAPYGGPQQPSYAAQPGYPPPGQPAPYPPQAPGGWQGQPPYSSYAAPRPDHPQSTLALVLGLVGLIGGFMLCGLPLVVSPFAWAIGRNAVKEIEASQGALGGEGQARTGMILGIIGTVLAILAVIALIGFIALVAVSETSTTGSNV
jgi:hypothetical protein